MTFLETRGSIVCGRVRSRRRLRFLLAVIGCGGIFAERNSHGQSTESLSGESASQALEQSIAAEPYDLQYGPVRGNVSARLGVNYTDNVFYSNQHSSDVMIEPETELDALWPISRLNTLRLSLDVSYEWYLVHSSLNSDTPLVNPGTELEFNLFVGDIHIQPHEKFSYQQSLFFNSPSGPEPFYNFNNISTFSRLDNQVGFDVTWSLEKALIKAGYNHEDFLSETAALDYLSRHSEWFTASAGYFLGDHLQAGLEGWFSLHNYDEQTILNDNSRARTGPFVEATFPEKITLRTGVGYDMARYDAAALGTSDYDTYYAYARVSQDTRLFSHSLEAGHETLLGDNANNMRTDYVRYTITSPVIAHVDLGANFGVNIGEESGGPSGFDERFTYYDAGVQAGWQFHKHARLELSYEFLLKNSDLPLRDFERDRVTLAVVWKL